MQEGSAEYSGKLVQIGVLQKALNGVGIPASEADLLFLRTAGLTRNPEDITRSNRTSLDLTGVPPGHAKRRADCVDLEEFLGRSKPPITDVDKYDAAHKIQSQWKTFMRKKTLREQELLKQKRASSKRAGSKGRVKSSERGSVTTS